MLMDLPRRVTRVERWLGWSGGSMLRIEGLACPEHLAAFLDFVVDASAAAALPAEAAFAIRLAAEAACRQVIAHDDPQEDAPGPLSLGFSHDAERVVLTLEYRGARFDLGGPGWHLIRELVDEVRYEPLAGGGNRLTLVKQLDSPGDG